MGQRSTPAIPALNYGYLSPRLRGRADLDFYAQSCDYAQNYIFVSQGEASYRGGSLYINNTRNNNRCRLLPFIYSTDVAYCLEFTAGFIRFYRDRSLITQTAQAITNITKADPAVLTYTGADYSNGDRVFVTGVGGMHQVNQREYIVANVNTGAKTFELQDVDGDDINSTSYSTYTSGGSVAGIYEIANPYSEAEILALDFAATEDDMYLVHPSFQPRKLTRGASDVDWTLSTVTFISNPFGTTTGAAKTVSGITEASPAVVTCNSHGYSNGDTIIIEGVKGMTRVNNVIFTVRNVTTNTFELEDYDAIDNDAYISGGTAKKYTAFSWPAVVTLYEGRIIYGASNSFPTRLWFSKIRRDGGLTDFTRGQLDTDGITYFLRGLGNNRIRWVQAAEDYLVLGTSAGEYRVSGGGDNNTISPTNISVKPSSFNGVRSIKPVRLDSYIMYVQRNGRIYRSMEYNALQDGYVSPNRTLLADHIGNSKATEMAYTTGTPNIVWSVREDGKLAGLTFNPEEQVVAWHLHKTHGNYESVATVPEAEEDDELWHVAKRTIGSKVVRQVSYTPDVFNLPVPEDYFSGKDNFETDVESYLAALWRKQRELVHVDAGVIYDGSALATVTIAVSGGVDEGSNVIITAGGSYFTQAMADDRRRIQTPDGGQIEITDYTSSTVVSGRVIYKLESAFFGIGGWQWMARGIGGLHHLEGLQVDVLADGGITGTRTVINGEITLDDDAGYVIVGLGYMGIVKTQDIVGAGRIGIGLGKPKAVSHVNVRMRNTMGTKFGTSLYNMETPSYRLQGEIAGRPPRLYSGMMQVDVDDGMDNEKYLYALHDTPTPSNIQYIQPMIEVNDQ